MTNPSDSDKPMPHNAQLEQLQQCLHCTLQVLSSLPVIPALFFASLCSFLSVQTNGFTTCWKAAKGSGEVTNGNVHALIYYDNHARVHKVNWVNREGLCAKLFIHFTNWGIFFSLASHETG